MRKQATTKLKGFAAFKVEDYFRDDVVNIYHEAQRKAKSADDISSTLEYRVYTHPNFQRLPAYSQKAIRSSAETLRKFLYRDLVVFAREINGEIVISREETPEQWELVKARAQSKSGFVWNHQRTAWYFFTDDTASDENLMLDSVS